MSKETELRLLKEEIELAVTELVETAKLGPGTVLVVGCSTSEVLGGRIGTDSSPEAGKALCEGVLSVLRPRGIYLAAQCCEHLNRAIIIERQACRFAQPVNVIPQPKAGGSFATAAYAQLSDPVAVEHIRADAGLDVGGTLIGMHLKEVAVPLRLSQKTVGCAALLAARTRPKFIGGSRAVYDSNLL